MLIQVNTDHNIEGREALSEYVRGAVEDALKHISSHITRVEVHLSDELGKKAGVEDKRCTIEAHLEGHQPMAVTHHATEMGQAVVGAADRLNRMLEKTVERLRDEARHRTDPFVPEPNLTQEKPDTD